MADDELLKVLQRLETELHQEETRRDRGRMEKLLHPEFREFSRSGRRLSREESLAELTARGARLPPVASEGFEVTRLGEAAALLTYVSAHLNRSGHPYRYTLRSSLWVLTPDGWRMRFHQGTPTDALVRTEG